MTDSLTESFQKICDCCWQDKCSEAGCYIVLPQKPGKTACMSGSLRQKNHDHQGKLCDCMFFWSHRAKDLVAAIELKGGKVDAKECIAQLQEGAKFIEEACGQEHKGVSFAPVLVHRKGIRPVESKLLKRLPIYFQGVKFFAIPAHSKQRFTELVRL